MTRPVESPSSVRDIDPGEAAVAAVDPLLARKVLDLGMRIAERLVASGASANDVVVTVLRLTSAYGLKTVHVDVTSSTIDVSYYRGFDKDPLTNMRVVRGRSVDFTTIERIQGLMREILTAPGLSINRASAKFRKILEAPHPYPQWFVTMGNAGLGLGTVFVFGGGLAASLITFVMGMYIERLWAFLSRHRMPPFMAQMICAFTVMMTASGVYGVGQNGFTTFGRLDPDLIVAGGIVMLVAGTTLTAAAQDAIDEFYVTAAARGLETAMLTAGIVVGILSGLVFAHLVGLNIPVSAESIRTGNLGWQLFGAAVTASAYAVATHARWRTVFFAAIAGIIAWLGYLLAVGDPLLLGLFGVTSERVAGPIPASTFGAFLAALITIPIARHYQVPPLAIISSAIYPLLPGSMLYRGLLQVSGAGEVGSDPAHGAMTLAQALGIGLAIALGVTLGLYVGRPLDERLQRWSWEPIKALPGLLNPLQWRTSMVSTDDDSDTESDDEWDTGPESSDSGPSQEGSDRV